MSDDRGAESKIKFSLAFNAIVAFDAFKEKEILQQSSSKFEIHQNQITQWNRAVFIASDGGNCFFNRMVNLSTEKITKFSVNGNG